MPHFQSMRNISKLVASLLVAAMFAAAFFVSSPSVKAADGTVTLTGGKTVTDPTSGFSYTGANILDGTAKAPTSSFTIVVADTSATTTGWKVTGSLDLTSGGTTLNGAKITGATFTQSTGTDAENTITSYTTPVALTGSGGVIAASNNASGEAQRVSIAFNTRLDIPAATLPGTYTGTLTLSIAPNV